MRDGKHVVKKEFFIYELVFKNGIKGFKRSTKNSNPYKIGVEYEFEPKTEKKSTVIYSMKPTGDELQRRISYSAMIESAMAFVINVDQNPTLERVDKVTRELLEYQETYAAGES